MPLVTQVMYFTPVLSVYRSPCDTGEVGTEPLRKIVDGVGGRFLSNLAAACGGLESYEVFHSISRRGCFW
jgi:hypothetical protein